MDTKAEEFRFAKKQQWYVATAAVTLIAAIFAVADKVHVTAFEKRGGGRGARRHRGLRQLDALFD